MSEAFDEVFQRLSAILRAAAPDMVVTAESPTGLTVMTRWPEARTGEPAWFGWIAVKKSYVAYHVMPLYTLPELAEHITPALEKRRQGKTCFNFKTIDEALFADLARLTEAAAGMEDRLRAAIG